MLGRVRGKMPAPCEHTLEIMISRLDQRLAREGTFQLPVGKVVIESDLDMHLVNLWWSG